VFRVPEVSMSCQSQDSLDVDAQRRTDGLCLSFCSEDIAPGSHAEDERYLYTCTDVQQRSHASARVRFRSTAPGPAG
jgi:hypothetical protein